MSKITFFERIFVYFITFFKGISSQLITFFEGMWFYVKSFPPVGFIRNWIATKGRRMGRKPYTRPGRMNPIFVKQSPYGCCYDTDCLVMMFLDKRLTCNGTGYTLTCNGDKYPSRLSGFCILITLLACLSAVVVFPHHLGPHI